jgi:hypothetical protein
VVSIAFATGAHQKKKITMMECLCLAGEGLYHFSMPTEDRQTASARLGTELLRSEIGGLLAPEQDHREKGP